MRARQRPGWDAVVIGASAGGLHALETVLGGLPAAFRPAVLIVQHRKSAPEDLLPSLLRKVCALPVRDVRDKEPIRPGMVYLAPPDYHLLVEVDFHLSLSVDDRVSFSRPSIDVLFESAAEAYGPRLVGVLLTGANQDGTAGLSKIMELGGGTIVQDPETAENSTMPRAAIAAGAAGHVLPLEAIAPFLVKYSPAGA